MAHTKEQLSISTAAVLCSVLALLIYLNSLDCGMCFDDDIAIIKNKDLKSNAPWSNLLWNDFWGVPMHSSESHKSYRPLSVATFKLNYLVHELQPIGYHLVNVLLHSVVCYLYVQLCGLVFREVWPALIAGLLFAVHPIHTEAVAGLVGRADVLAGLFFLGSLLSYLKATLPSSKLNVRWLAMSIFLCLCSVLSKEQGITVVAVWLTYDFFVLQKPDVNFILEVMRNSRPKQKLSKSVSQFMKRATIVVMFTVIFMAFRLRLMHGAPLFPLSLNPAMALDTPYRQLHWSYLCSFNSWLLLSPSRLSPEYAMGAIPLVTTISDPRTIATVMTFAVMLVFGLYGINGRGNSRNVVIVAVSIIVFSYLPASNLFFPVGFVVAERVLYIPSMGFCILVGYGIWHLLTSQSRIFSFLAKLMLVYILLVHSLKTAVRNRDWYSEFTLYESAVKAIPHNARMLHNLATKYEKESDHTYAEDLMRFATQMEPQYVSALSDLGTILSRQQRMAEAEELYRRAIEVINKGLNGDRYVTIYATDVVTFGRLANIVKQNSSRLQEAYELCQNALLIVPSDAKAHREMGDILMRMGRLSEAKSTLHKAIQLEPRNAFGHYYMGQLHARNGNLAKSENSYRTALSIAGNNVPMMLDLAAVLTKSKEIKKLQEAEILLTSLLSHDPSNVDAWFASGLLYYELKAYRSAEEALKQTLELSSQHQEALYQLGKLHYDLQTCDLAIKYLTMFLRNVSDHHETVQIVRKCYMQLLETHSATEIFEMMLDEDATDQDLLYNLGTLSANAGEVGMATEFFTHILQLNPHHELAMKKLEQL